MGEKKGKPSQISFGRVINQEVALCGIEWFRGRGCVGDPVHYTQKPSSDSHLKAAIKAEHTMIVWPHTKHEKAFRKKYPVT